MNEAALKKLLSGVRGKEAGEFEGPREGTAPTAETLAASILSGQESHDVDKILQVWKETFGMDLDRDRVTKHLRGLREWQSRWRGLRNG